MREPNITRDILMNDCKGQACNVMNALRISRMVCPLMSMYFHS